MKTATFKLFNLLLDQFVDTESFCSRVFRSTTRAMAVAVVMAAGAIVFYYMVQYVVLEDQKQLEMIDR